ncbi:hypothetical protein SAPIO_CDS1472 [Scedosporium apiospermum]|uniref:Uncharacterized protein n=1 Tax=Pseudallescheria apiosperma TaxID=563466 RepID=A0A084GED5_PSEDA|nr:uncharacterized protein SAPIO_CDS1472 [Scedosporium apiospermum]KEZ45697.1 hypothetical protein SAPIO_CDS1472 [Scedosporium apiospermum]
MSKAIIIFERIQLVIRVLTLILSYGIIALWIFVAVKWDDPDGARESYLDARALRDVNLWFGIPLVCATFAAGFDTWEIIALSGPVRTRARPGVLLTHEFLNILCQVFGMVFGYRSPHNELYYNIADSGSHSFTKMYNDVAKVSIAFLAARCFMFMIVVFDACFWEGGRELTVRRRIPEWKNQI